MIEYKNNKINSIPELKIGDEELSPKIEWATRILKLIFKKEIKFTWRW